jgi:hypothetical protein
MKFQACSTFWLSFEMPMLSPPTNVDWPVVVPAIAATPMLSSAIWSVSCRLAGIGMIPILPCGK